MKQYYPGVGAQQRSLPEGAATQPLPRPDRDIGAFWCPDDCSLLDRFHRTAFPASITARCLDYTDRSALSQRPTILTRTTAARVSKHSDSVTRKCVYHSVNKSNTHIFGMAHITIFSIRCILAICNHTHLVPSHGNWWPHLNVALLLLWNQLTV